LGIQAQAKVIEAKHDFRMSLGQTKKLMKSYGLTVSRGGLQQILHRAAKVFKPAVVEIKAHIQSSPVAWADETALKVNGKSGYLWMVMTRQAVLFEADHSRGQLVAQRLLNLSLFFLRGTSATAYHSTPFKLNSHEERADKEFSRLLRVCS
jgi:transposase-like protein